MIKSCTLRSTPQFTCRQFFCTQTTNYGDSVQIFPEWLQDSVALPAAPAMLQDAAPCALELLDGVKTHQKLAGARAVVKGLRSATIKVPADGRTHQHVAGRHPVWTDG